MKPLVLITLLCLTSTSARADDAPDPYAAGQRADAENAVWKRPGAQKGAVQGAPNAPPPAASADEPTAAYPAGNATAQGILSAWAHGCQAIAELIASKGAPSPKRGIGVPYRMNNAGAIVGLLGSQWYYTWGTTPVTGTNVEFTPMIYEAGNGGSDVENNLQELDKIRPLPQFVLSYNEPDLSQHNNPEDKTWAQSYAPRLPPGAGAVSPASSSLNDWFNEFVKSDGARQFPIIAIHLYEEGVQANDPGSVDRAVADFERRLENVVEAAARPVWVTEFGLATSGATKENPAAFTDAQAACFMAQVIPYLEKKSTRYAWSSPSRGAKKPLEPTLPDALWSQEGELTPLGELYKQ